MSTSNRMHGEFLRLLFLQAHRETRSALHCRWNAIATQSIGIISVQARGILPRPVGLAAAKAAALRINLNVQGCSIVAAPMHAPSRISLLLPLLLSHDLPLPRVH